MKISCTIEEYSRIIRSCQRSIVLGECKGCALENICNQQILEDSVRFEIVDNDELDIEYVTFETSE